MTVPVTYPVGLKGRILIVDDELVVRDSLQKWFDSEGYDAGAVSSGREALFAVQQKQYDLAQLLLKLSTTSCCSTSRCPAWTAWNSRRSFARWTPI